MHLACRYSNASMTHATQNRVVTSSKWPLPTKNLTSYHLFTPPTRRDKIVLSRPRLGGVNKPLRYVYPLTAIGTAPSLQQIATTFYRKHNHVMFYNTITDNTKLVHWSAISELLHFVQRWMKWALSLCLMQQPTHQWLIL